MKKLSDAIMSSKVLVIYSILLFAAQAVKGRTGTDVPKLEISPRIFNGDDAAPREFSHQISLQTIDAPGRTSTPQCGGAIINSLWILTAAHCIIDVTPQTQFVVKAGKNNLKIRESGEQSVPVAEIFMHESYKASPRKNDVGPYDIALLKLKTPLKLNKLVGKISLPKIGTKPTGYGTVSGWGSIRGDGRGGSDILQKAVLPIIDYATCKTFFGNSIHPTNICAGRAISNQASICDGDSGGPLIQKKASGVVELIGVVSWSTERCDVKDAPAVFVDVAQFVDWIQATMKKH